MNIIRKVLEEKRIIINAEIEFCGEVAELSLVGTLEGAYGDTFKFFVQVTTSDTFFKGYDSRLKYGLWTAEERHSWKDWTFEVPAKFLEFLNTQREKLELELRG